MLLGRLVMKGRIFLNVFAPLKAAEGFAVLVDNNVRCWCFAKNAVGSLVVFLHPELNLSSVFRRSLSVWIFSFEPEMVTDAGFALRSLATCRTRNIKNMRWELDRIIKATISCFFPPLLVISGAKLSFSGAIWPFSLCIPTLLPPLFCPSAPHVWFVLRRNTTLCSNEQQAR